MVSVGAPDGGPRMELSGRASSSGSKGEEGALTARAEAEKITSKASKMQIDSLRAKNERIYWSGISNK